MFKRLLQKISGSGIRPEDLTVAQAIEILDRAGVEARSEVAGASKDPEILDYLGRDQVPAVRARVAANIATPRDLDLSLAEDEADEVRLELARKISRLLPDLRPSKAVALREATIALLERLSKDQLPLVRQIVAEEIKASDLVPKTIALDLARDAEAAVAAPILEYSPLLSDKDLVEIIAGGQVDTVLAAIARRKGLSEDVSDAVVAAFDIPAVAVLLANSSAKIRAETLDKVAEQAESVSAWQEPLVMRPELSLRAIRRISGFVAASLLTRLSERHGLDDETRLALQRGIKDRLEEATDVRNEPDARERALERVRVAAAQNRLDDEFIVETIAADDRQGVVFALCARAGLPEGAVERVLNTRNGQLVAALCWHAGFSMRTAYAIQSDLLHLSGRDLVLARNGTDFPLPEDHMRSQLEFVGIVAAKPA